MTGRVVIAGSAAHHLLTGSAPGPCGSREPYFVKASGRTFLGSDPDSSIKPLVLEVAR
jgi:hypothetical protein